ncbi:MAG TPA: NADH-quinone oxidoreductase subunit C [Kiritimatiellae bacterium]|nr:NADH-quinone oxidoreductase subunit C [Kiritimatiellia bacterium]
MSGTPEPLPEIVRLLQGKAGAAIGAVQCRTRSRIYVDVESAAVPDLTRIMFRELGYRLQTVTGTDAGSHIELLYHWASDREGFVVSLRTRVDRQRPQIDSIAGICKGAEWIEREIWELLGVHFRNHPDLRHLLLRDDWPQGDYPLRRDRGRGGNHG